VLAIQRSYAEAGSDCILTNTFGGSRIMLNRHGNSGKGARDQSGGRRHRAAGVQRTRRIRHRRYRTVRRSPRTYGDFTEADVRDAFTEQARALVDAGADAIIIETQTSLEELLIGIEAAREAGRALRDRLHGV